MILEALDEESRGRQARFGPAEFPQIDFGETLIVPTPAEGGDGRAANEPKREKQHGVRSTTGTMTSREEAVKGKEGDLTTK